MSPLSTGEVAQKAGVEYQTVLFYETEGLIEEPPRAENGYRQFPKLAVQKIRFIQRAQQLGFSLEEIAELLELQEGTKKDCEEVQRFAETHLEEIHRKLEYYQRLEKLFQQIIKQCQETGRFEACPIVNALTGAEDAAPSQPS